MRKFLIIITFLVVLSLFINDSALSTSLEPASDLTTSQTKTITPADATALAVAMDIATTDLVAATIGTSDPNGAGTSNSSLSFFPQQGDTFAILSSGRAESADDPDSNNSEVLGGGGSTDDISTALDGLNNNAGQDLVQLTLTLTPPTDATSLSFDFAFYSEEFPDYIDTSFNDVFIAELWTEPFTSELTVDGSKIIASKNIAIDPTGRNISVNSAFGFDPDNPNPDTGTTYDGTSGLLKATGCLPETRPTGNVVLILSITDLSDSILDSAVFLDNFQWDNPESCTSGVNTAAIDLSPKMARNPIDTIHTVTATISDENGNPLPAETVGFKVVGANNTSGSGTSDVNGQVSFSYSGTVLGDDTITAWADLNNNGTQDSNEIFALAFATWETKTNLIITKRDLDDPVTAGEQLTYVIDITNSGPEIATQLLVTDTLPPAVTFVSVTPNGSNCSEAAGVISCQIETLGASENHQIIVTTDVISSGNGKIFNQVSVASSILEEDYSDNTFSEKTTIQPLLGSITVSNQAAELVGDQKIGFESDPKNFQLGDNQTITLNDLVTGQYKIVETSFPNRLWGLLWVECADEFLPIQQFEEGPGVIIDLAPGEDLSCIFHNEKAAFYEENAALYFPIIIK